MKLGVVILAAGQGTRMRSDLPKVLHRLAGKPLLEHVVDAAQSLNPASTVVVYGHGGDAVREVLGRPELSWAEQAEQLGTGHAVEQALPMLPDVDKVLVLYGDVPLIDPVTLKSLINTASESPLTVLTTNLKDPTGYGRILRSPQGRVVRVVEQKDTTPEERKVREINTGVLVADAEEFRNWLNKVDNKNAQGEFYLTDVIGLAVADGVEVLTVQPGAPEEVMGVNDRVQLARLERYFQRALAQELMLSGVTLRDPERIDIRGRLVTGRDLVIDVNTVFEGEVKLGHRVQIGPNTLIRDSHIGDDVVILPNCVIENATIGPGCRIGPFSRFRPDTELADGVHVGNFVEIKKSTVANGSKINHLSYIGDADIGRNVNVGAGTITCNYDGAYKHKTVIGDGAFIGSDTQLVAPVTVGAGATIGAGTTVTRDTPPGKLTLSRSQQLTVEGWRRPVKKPKKSQE